MSALPPTHALFRPPAEAGSLIIRVADGCPWNRCTFCGMYKGVQSRLHSMETIEQSVIEAARAHPRARRIFLADGDVMSMPFDRLKAVLGLIRSRLPLAGRINLYANGRSILGKRAQELCELRRMGLQILYMGLESGHDPVLRQMQKRESADEMIAAAQRAQACGLKMSVMILNGLGGQQEMERHVRATAQALNRMQPRLLSVLRVIPVPGTDLHAAVQAGRFTELTEFQAIEEMRNLIRRLELERTLFRANHASNRVPLAGRFPRDKAHLLEQLNALLAAGTLDRTSPGLPPMIL
jgi:radical SAM superfamily enzyme YgiQ (UPF0313 family)